MTKHIYQVLFINTDDYLVKTYQSDVLDKVLDESYADYCKLAKMLYEENNLIDCSTDDEFRNLLCSRESWLGDGFGILETHYETYIYVMNEFDL